MNSLRKAGLTLLVAATLINAPAIAQTTTKKPNILVIMTDDVGMWNISAYHRGMMGGKTPNIDRIANEGALCVYYWAASRTHRSVGRRAARRDSWAAEGRPHNR